MIYQILEELNENNSTNYKKAVLEKHKDNKLLQSVLKMTYDRVSFTYGVTMKNIPAYTPLDNEDLGWALESMAEYLATRKTTGNAANNLIHHILSMMSKENALIIEKVLDRDLKIRLGRTEINKVFKNLIVKPPYTRCEIGTSKNILKNMPTDKDGQFINKVFSQKKEDGTFRRAIVDGGSIDITSRPGIETEFPLIEQELVSLNVDGYVFIGEMTLRGEKNRTKGNGIINSITEKVERESDILYTIWDMIPVQEFRMTKDEIKQAEKDKSLSLYEDRFEMLSELLELKDLKNVELIETRIVKNMIEAYAHFQELTADGFEGTVIKAHDMTHKDGNSKKQLKVKLEIYLDMRCTGFTDGKKGTKREATFGAMTFTNDEGTIVGQCSGFTDELLEEINENRESYIGKVFEGKGNDITKARNKTAHALSHFNFQQWRSKDTTDSLERALELKEMAMELK